jgi:hypothetical protein
VVEQLPYLLEHEVGLLYYLACEELGFVSEGQTAYLFSGIIVYVP